MAGPGRGPIFEDESFPSKEIEKKFYSRVRVLSANFFNPEIFTPGAVIWGEGAGFAEVMLSESAAWGLSVDWAIPNELKELARTKAASNLTPIKKGALLKQLGQRYPKLSDAMQANEAGFKECRVPDTVSPGKKKGFYYLEKIVDLCAAKWEPTDPPVGGITPRTIKPSGK